MPQIEESTKVKVNSKVKEPPMFRVIYINDNTTSMEFVVESLVRYFGYSADTAEQITMDIHQTGAAVVAVLPYEIAEQKGVEITVDARQQGYPLQIKIEPDVS